MSREDQIKYAEQIIAGGCSDELKAILEKDFPELVEGKSERIRKQLIEKINVSAQLTYQLQRHGINVADLLDWLNQQKEPSDKGEISDGYHTFNELYYYRMLYNAAFFNLLPKEWVHKSKRHHNGEECFGGGWFIVIAQLPTGQISNHYELKDWDLFQVPEKEIADEWDGHTPQEAAERLHRYLLEKNQKSRVFIPKFQVGDKVISTRNYHLTYEILEVGNVNEFGNLEYKVETFTDGKAGVGKEAHNIHFIECRKMDEWAELIEPRSVEWQDDYREEDLQARFAFYTYKDEPNVLFLSNLFVEEVSRNKGLGTKILQSAEGVARALGASSIMLQAKLGTPAIDLYLKNGFECITEQGGYGWFEKKVEATTANFSEENEKAIHLACEFIRHRVRANDNIGGVNCLDLIKKLKSIQLGKQWSKDDEAAIDYLIDYCNSQENGKHPILETNIARKLSNWLYRLKSGEIDPNPHSCWKPSNEQVESLKSCIDGEFESFSLDSLESLYNELKQLV
jgi:GNAT superfamily N-acetyltransferase